MATSLRPICWAICSKLSFLWALALKRVAADAGRLGCCVACSYFISGLSGGSGGSGLTSSVASDMMKVDVVSWVDSRRSLRGGLYAMFTDTSNR